MIALSLSCALAASVGPAAGEPGLPPRGLSAYDPQAGQAARAATVVVAASDSSALSRAQADYVADGHGDQEEINAAIRALPEGGGAVLLMEGTYDIRRVEGKLGGVIIDRSGVTLAGQGAATRLVLAAGQDTNVVRIIGSGVGDITIRDLFIDANRDQNPHGAGDPDVSHARFEFCGIKAYCSEPGRPRGEPTHDITVRSVTVVDAHALGIMLEGPNMKVINNRLGNATSDAVEILTGPGEIRGNYVEITGRTHVAIGTDRADSVIMADNIVRVRPGGDLDIALRSWAGSSRHAITGNIVTVEAGGRCQMAMDIRGVQTTVSGNCLHSATDEPLRLRVAAGDAVISANALENVVIEVDDETGEDRPVIVAGNVMRNSTIDHRRGNLVSGP